MATMAAPTVAPVPVPRTSLSLAATPAPGRAMIPMPVAVAGRKEPGVRCKRTIARVRVQQRTGVVAYGKKGSESNDDFDDKASGGDNDMYFSGYAEDEEVYGDFLADQGDDAERDVSEKVNLEPTVVAAAAKTPASKTRMTEDEALELARAEAAAEAATLQAESSTATPLASAPVREERPVEPAPSTSAASGPPSSDGGELIDGVERAVTSTKAFTLGRRARKFLGDTWRSFSGLGQMVSDLQYVEDMYYTLPEATLDDFRAPQAPYTKVLVCGATGRVGRVLVRKLLLRGYSVRALVREDAPEDLEEMLPTAVEAIRGDVRDPAAVARAVRGCEKVICCVRPRDTNRAEMEAVNSKGPAFLSTALQNEFAMRAAARQGTSSKAKYVLHKFQRGDLSSMAEEWTSRTETTRSDTLGEVSAVLAKYRASLTGQSKANLELITSSGGKKGSFSCLKFTGEISNDGGAAEAVAPLSSSILAQTRPRNATLGESIVDEVEQLVLRLSAPIGGRQYQFELIDCNGNTYIAPFFTRQGYFTVRIPLRAMQAKGDAPPLGTHPMERLAIRYENKGVSRFDKSKQRKEDIEARRTFELCMHFIKASPTGTEPDIVLVSCAGAGVDDPSMKADIVRTKSGGEEAVKRSGLNYTIVRPPELIEVPSSSVALMFDQGDRVATPISCADVADVCLNALHDEAAVNKTFEVAYENQSDDYELVGSVTRASQSYLTAGVAPLAKNT